MNAVEKNEIDVIFRFYDLENPIKGIDDQHLGR